MASPEPPHVPVIPPPRFFFGVALGAAILFVIWTLIVRPWDESPSFDVNFADYWHDYSATHPDALAFMQFLTELGGIACITMLTIVGSIWQTAIKHRTLAIAWLAIVLSGAMLNQGVKEAFGRQRPPNPAFVVHEKNNSYPSGHSMGCLIGYGLLGYALILPQRRRPRRIVAINLMIVIVIAIGFSRMYLRAHWFSDVVGGFMLGIAWLFLCLGWLERRRLRLQGGG